MEIKSPYLEAIQSIAGTTPGEKHKTIHAIAKQLAGIESAGDNSEDLDNPVTNVPEPLKPLVQVEVAKILHRHGGIIEALKSDDPVVVARAVQADWFFDGSNTELVNAQYFCESVIPKISLFARLRMIKGFAKHLKNTSVAADFFTTIAEVYGLDQALPLLVVCEEEFAFNEIIKRKIVLTVRQVEVLYRKYPNLVIKYLKYGKPEGNDVRNAYSVDIRDYVEFIPELSVKHFEEFMEIYKLVDFGNLKIKLYKKAVSTFLKTHQNLLVEKPNQYLKLLPLEKVTRKMSHENFLKMFKNLFPNEKRKFQYREINDILKYYEPAEEKLTLIRRTFHEVYGEDLIDDQDLVDDEIMQILPAAERVKMARLKLENDTDWHASDPSESWRCYLPTNESIPLITKEIAKSSDARMRRDYLRLLVYTCKINNDKDALLKVMNYFYDRHRNEVANVLVGFIYDISSSFDLVTLSSAHWTVLTKYIKLVEVQGKLIDEATTLMVVIESAIHYCLMNDLPLDDYLRMFIDMKIDRSYIDSNLFKKYPRFEKKLLELVIEKIPKQYPFDNIEFWKKEEYLIVDFLTSSLWDFNKRNRKLESNLKQLSIKDYPWLFNRIKDYIFDDDDRMNCDKEYLLRSLNKNEKIFYDAWLLELPKFWTFGTNVVYETLRKRPQRVFDNWIECLKNDTRSDYYADPIFIRFIKKSRWYQYLPINIFNESLKTCKDSVKTTRSMFLLASLGDGESYTKIIEPFIPADEKIDVEDPNAKKNVEILSAITRVLFKVNPPVSLDTVAKFCVGDYLKMAIGSMFSLSSRVPISDVMPFIKTLMDRRVSVKKHGVRLVCSVAPLEEMYAVLTDLWKTEKHTSIRCVIFNKVQNFFPKQADCRGWCLLRMCLNDLNTDDDAAIFQTISKLNGIPDEYIHDYIKTALNILKSIKEKSHDKGPFIKASCNLIKSIDRLITDILPEEYCQELIKEYLFASEYHEYIFDAGLSLSLNSYLLVPGDHFESRYKFFETLFRDTVQKYWDKPDTKTVYRYPTKLMVNKFFNRLIHSTLKRTGELRTFETFLKIFESVLQPQQDATSYLGLVYSIIFHKSNNLVEFAEMTAHKIPELIEIFSPELIIFISEELSDFLQRHEFDELQIEQGKIFTVIKIFVNSGSIHCALIAAQLLLRNRSNVYDEQYQTMVQTLRNFDHPGISALINKRLIDQSN